MIIIDSIHHVGKNILAYTGYVRFTIPKHEFEEWVTEESKRDYCGVVAGSDGEPVEDSGTLAWWQYYESRYFAKDFEEYVNMKYSKVKK